MENKKTTQPKTKVEKFKIEEIISATSGCVVRNVDLIGNYNKIGDTLRHSEDYKYDYQKSLSENIYAAFPQYKLKEVTEKFEATLKSWKVQGKDETFINNAINATIMTMAINAGIPKTLTINVKEETKSETPKNSPIAGQHDFGYYDFKDSIDKPEKSTGVILNSVLEKMGIKHPRS